MYGDVWAIGGAQLKISAAINEGCDTVFIPYDNYVQLEEDNKLSTFNCDIIPVKTVDDVIKVLFPKEKLINNDSQLAS